ncbi:TPA: hypothetical protein EYN23_14840 [Candidatus Poribacteria bacterium]|nr:hypothetical protein [Candidatus Poribacteria bacterium]
MAHFKFEDMTRVYFKTMEKSSSSGKFKDLISQYWLCALLGIAHNENQKDPEDPKEIVDNFAGPLKEHQHLIRALLFWKYVDKKGYSVDDTTEITTALKEVFDEQSESKLSQTAHNELDRYAAAGFMKLREKIPHPHDLATFLVDYCALLDTNNNN